MSKQDEAKAHVDRIIDEFENSLKSVPENYRWLVMLRVINWLVFVTYKPILMKAEDLDMQVENELLKE